MKVYCADCKYRERFVPETAYLECKIRYEKIYNPNFYENYFYKKYEYCCDKNGDNNCVDYKPSLLKRIKEIFKL